MGPPPKKKEVLNKKIRILHNYSDFRVYNWPWEILHKGGDKTRKQENYKTTLIWAYQCLGVYECVSMCVCQYRPPPKKKKEVLNKKIRILHNYSDFRVYNWIWEIFHKSGDKTRKQKNYKTTLIW